MIKCLNCSLINDIPTGGRHKTEKGRLAWDANSKLAAGMINSGLEETQINSLLAVLNVPTIASGSLKNREREVGTELLEMTEESRRQQLASEAILSDNDISVGFDGAWQKRGTCRAYNSLAGEHASCGEWCKNEKSGYRPKKLPYGKPLTDQSLRKTLVAFFAKYTSKSTELANMGSTQANESFNQMVSSKAPKRVRHIQFKHMSNICLDTAPYIDDIHVETGLPDRDFSDSSMIIFDLETTGFELTADIVQIAALCGDKSLSVYINPTKPIGLKASEVTALTFTGGILHLKGKEVSATTIQDGLNQFLTLIKSFKNPLLVGNNIQSFDLPRLFHQLNYMGEFKSAVQYFLDTLKLAKHIIPKTKCENYKQKTLVKLYLEKDYEAHDALDDARTLKELYDKKLGADSDIVSKHLFNFNYFSCKASLESLVKRKVISPATMRKLVEILLGLSQLKTIYQRDPQNGIRNMFIENVSETSKTPRISKSNVVIDEITQYLTNTCM